MQTLKVLLLKVLSKCVLPGEKGKTFSKKLVTPLVLLFLVGGISASSLPMQTKTEAVQSAEYYTSGSASKVSKTTKAQELKVNYIDVGQGSATLLTCGNQSMLIDAGDNDEGTTIQLYLKKQGIKTLDYVVGTHPDSDHIGGLDVVLYKFDCKTILMPDYENDTDTYRDVLVAMESKGYKNTLPKVGKTYLLGDATITILSPNNYNYGDNSNNYSIALLVTHGENTFLFTGDAEEEAEADILKNGINIDADVLEVGHHGSKTASSQAFLNAVTPDYAVISCGEGNSYGHPHSQTLNSLRKMGVKVFRTDEQGTLVATSDGKKISWNSDPSTTWQAGEASETSTSTSTTTTSKTTPKTKTSAAVVATPASAANTTTVAPPVATVEAPVVATNNDGLEVHITETGKKYHFAGCQYLSKSDIVTTLSQAKSLGLEPCSKCNPPQ